MSAYMASIITTVALLVSTVVKVSHHLMSYYHIHVLIVYMGILGGPMVLASVKLEEELRKSPLLQSAQFVWAGATLGLAIYGLAANNTVKEKMEICPNVALETLWTSQKWAIVIDSLAMIFGFIVLNRAVIQLGHAFMPLLSKKIIAGMDKILERFREVQDTIYDRGWRAIVFIVNYLFMKLHQVANRFSLVTSSLIVLSSVAFAVERYVNPHETEDAERMDFLMTPLLICFGEAYRATYTPLLNGQSEGNWTFGQIFPVTLLLLPLVELVRNASNPVAPGGVSKFRAWVNTRNHTPKMKSPFDSSGKLPFFWPYNLLIIVVLQWLYYGFIAFLLKPIFACILSIKDGLVSWQRKDQGHEVEGINHSFS